MQKKEIFRLGFLALTLVLSQGALALGLGKLTVQSALGQPLSAQVELMGTSDEFSELTAKIASPALYQEKDLVYQAVLTRTRVTLETRANGGAFLKIASSQPVSEPYVDLLIEVNWPSGHALREYTVLLDPPAAGTPEPVTPAAESTVGGRTKREATGGSTAPVAKVPPTTAPPTTAPKAGTSGAPSTPPKGQRPMPKSRVTGQSGASGAAGGDTYTVQRGDTLSGIVKTYKPEEVTLNQALTAMYEANQSAFINKNMNRMRSGAVLQVPSKDDMAAVEPRKANRVVHVQVAEWRSYLEQVANQTTAQAHPQGKGSQTSGGTITTPPKVIEPSKTGDHVEVSSGAGDAKGGTGKGAGNKDNAKAAANAAAEDKIARQKEIDELNSRIKDLEEINKKQQLAFELKNKQLADAQAQAEANNKAKAAADAAKAKEAEDAAKAKAVEDAAKAKAAEDAAKAKAEEDAKKAQAAQQPTTQPPSQPTGQPQTTPQPQPGATPQPGGATPQPEGAAQPPVKPPVKPPVVKQITPPPPEPSLVDTIIGTVSEYWMACLGIVVLLVLIIAGLAYRRRRAEEAVVDSLFGATTTGSTMTGGMSQRSSSLSTMTGGGEGAHSAAASANSNSILSEFSREGLGSIDTGEVDPLAEADVYLAYGRAQQAEEILQEALKRGPDRQDVYLKLLEVFADQKKTTEFEATAKQLQSLTQGKGEFWQAAVALGQRLLPGNALFAATLGGNTDVEITRTRTDTTPLQVGGQAVDPRGFASMESRSIAERAADIANRAVETRGTATQPPAKDFTFSMESTAPAAEKEDFGVDLDLEELSRFKNFGRTEERVDQPTSPQQPEMEFNLDEFDAPQIDSEKEQEFRAPSLAELDFSDNENDSIAEEPAPSIIEGQWHDAATKLDLARAYQATGDAEACREILQEVLNEGDEQQKAEANAILKSLA